MAKNTNYTSETMNFIRELRKNNPQLSVKQDQLRQTWWDKNDDEVKQQRELDDSNLPTASYAYCSYDKK